jgi:hypothetical protein
MNPDDLWEAVQLADRLTEAAKLGHVKPEEDKLNAILLRALQIFEGKLEHETEPDDDRRTSNTRRGRRNVSAGGVGD